MDRQTQIHRAAQDRRARALRQEMSRTEWRLWVRLRGRQLLGHKFRRQVPIGPYFADFVCLEARLLVEVDGEHHSDQVRYDARRDQWFGEMGFRVLRFWASQLDEDLEGVIAAIADAVGHLDPPPISPRARGEGTGGSTPLLPPRVRGGRGLAARPPPVARPPAGPP